VGDLVKQATHWLCFRNPPRLTRWISLGLRLQTIKPGFITRRQTWFQWPPCYNW